MRQYVQALWLTFWFSASVALACEGSFTSESFLSHKMSIDRLLKAQRASRTSVELYINQELGHYQMATEYDRKVQLFAHADEKSEALLEFLQEEGIVFREIGDRQFSIQLSLRDLVNLIIKLDPFDYDSNLLFQPNFASFKLVLD